MNSPSVVSLAKPLEANELASIIRMLPPLPEVAHQILARFSDEFISGNEVADIVECDPAISARLFGLANSAYFGLSRPVAVMREVVSRVLGPDTVRSLAFAIATEQLFDLERCAAFDANRFWHRSLYSASAAQRIVLVIEDVEPTVKDFAYLAGMCHGLGVLALACCYPEKMSRIFEQCEHDDGVDLRQLCLDAFGFSFEDVTYELALHWDLPESIVEAYKHRALKDSANNLMAAVVDASVKSARYTEHLSNLSEGAELRVPSFSEDLPYVEQSILEAAALGTDSQRMATQSRLRTMVG